MADIFFSYSSKDRAKIQRVRDTLVSHGFSVFWDQEVPASTDWDSWIRQQLNDATCALVVWSENSVASDNVRHEAWIAKRQNKIIPVLMDVLEADRFPMGLYAVQAVNLSGWAGDPEHDEWKKLLRELESKLAPAWMKVLIDSRDAELVSERARRESAERRDRTLRQQIAKEAESRQTLEVELLHARDEVNRLTASTLSAEQRWSEAERTASELSKQVTALTSHVKEADAARGALDGTLLQSRHEVERLTTVAQDAERRRSDAETRVSKLGEEVAALTARVREMAGTIDTLRAELLQRASERPQAKVKSPPEKPTPQLSLKTKEKPVTSPNAMAELRNQLENLIQQGRDLTRKKMFKDLDRPACHAWQSETRKWLKANFPIGAYYDFDQRNITGDVLETLEKQIAILGRLKTNLRPLGR